jgi:hypothetical protein
MNLYPIKDFSPIIYYLKLNMIRDRKTRTIYFTQTAAINRILKKAEITECSSYTTSMKSDLQLEGIQDNSQIIN